MQMNKSLTLKDNLEIDPILHDKIKKEEDLFSFINNRIDKISNYNLLLGAGASVMSGIYTAQQLIEKWRNDVFYSFENNKDEEFDIEKAQKFFSYTFGREYDVNREYSFLFKQKYHLPTQRRNFVEMSVKNAIPSIGYRYLANLVRANYFNTIFTTNFDDLIEQSLLSANLELKPIICSHDASISSIPVVSNRPKIIKLHGDFLFDDIKTTLTETTRLEENMKNKFEEFLKNFGLIVIGYSGNDDSIMDILEKLIKKDGFLDGGLYWCTRDVKEIEKNYRLKKLLLNDKAFIVPIIGFDDFFAKLNHFISDKNYEKDPFQKYKDDICSFEDIDKTIEQFKDNKLIIQDCENYKKNLPEILSKTLKTVSDKFGYKDVDDSVDLINLSRFEEDPSLKENISKLNNLLKESASPNLIIETIENIEKKSYIFSDVRLFNMIENTKLLLLEKKHDKEETIQTLLNLKQFNDDRNYFYENVYIDLVNEYIDAKKWDQAINVAQEALQKNKQNDKIYLLLAKAQEFKLRYGYKEDNVHLIDEIKTNYLKSIEYNPSVKTNSTYRNFTDFLLSDNNIHFSDEEFIKYIIRPFEEQHLADSDYPYIVAEKAIFDFQKNKDNPFDLIDKLYEENNISIINYQMSLFRNFLKVCTVAKRTTEFETCKNKIPVMFKKTIWYIKAIAHYELSVKNDLNKAISILQDNLNIDIDNQLLMLLLKFKLYAEDYTFVTSNLEKLKSDDAQTIKVDYCVYSNNNDELYKISERLYQNSNKQYSDLMAFSYHLLICNKFKECYELLNGNTHNDSILEINYELARKGINKNIRTDKISSLYEQSEKQIKAATCVLLDKKDEAINILKSIIEEDFEHYYQIKPYPVFKPILQELKKLLP